jgi:hypothetical protein|tara:strand:- start:113 stop:442 length:330 start_codon:yes stop_codon:yes gene_type:complete
MGLIYGPRGNNGMNTNNKCESQIAGVFGECDKYDKNGKHSYGTGKIVADVTYYNKSQGMDNTFTWGCCENCTKLYRDWNTGDNDYEDSVVVEIKYNDDREDYYNYPVIH